VIAYDRKREFIMKRITKKGRIILDSSIIITMEEKLLITKHAKTYELISAGMAITDSTLDQERRDEKEIYVALKKLEHFWHRGILRVEHLTMHQQNPDYRPFQQHLQSR
jgi:hypothetical protein